jgi:transcriptional regulator with XRE-family HTH domain
MKLIRQAEGLSLLEVSRITGIPVSYILDLEERHKNDVENIPLIAKALDVTPEHLCEYLLTPTECDAYNDQLTVPDVREAMENNWKMDDQLVIKVRNSVGKSEGDQKKSKKNAVQTPKSARTSCSTKTSKTINKEIKSMDKSKDTEITGKLPFSVGEAEECNKPKNDDITPPMPPEESEDQSIRDSLEEVSLGVLSGVVAALNVPDYLVDTYEVRKYVRAVEEFITQLIKLGVDSSKFALALSDLIQATNEVKSSINLVG